MSIAAKIDGKKLLNSMFSFACGLCRVSDGKCENGPSITLTAWGILFGIEIRSQIRVYVHIY